MPARACMCSERKSGAWNSTFTCVEANSWETWQDLQWQARLRSTSQTDAADREVPFKSQGYVKPSSCG